MPRITAAEIEHAIEHPADGQVGLLLDFEWLVPQIDGAWWSIHRDSEFPTHYVFTAPERMEPLLAENRRGREFAEKPYPMTTEDGWNLVRPMHYQSALERCELVPIRGRDLFAQLAATTDYHSVQVNSSCDTWNEPNKNGALLIACGGTRQLTQGLDPRPGTRTLPARSIAEIHRNLQSFHGLSEFTHRLEYAGEKLVAVYEGVDAHGRAHRQVFTPVEPQPDPLDYGPGVSAILCGGLLAFNFDSHRSTLRENFHRRTRESLHESTPELLRRLDELLKMLDPQTDRIGPEFFRFDHAPGFVKNKPQVITGAWLRETRGEFERFLAGGPEFRV